eukprot:14426213-Heterocapsa_arctica.AAC.1
MGHRARISRLSRISALLGLLAKGRLQQTIPSAVIVAIGENAGSGAKEPEFNPEQRIDKGWWPKGKFTSTR